MGELSHVGDDGIQGFNHFLMPDAFLDDDEDGVIAGNGTDDFRNVAAVNVPGNGAGIARARLDDTHVARKVDTDEPWYLHHLFNVAWCGYTLVHRVVGQNIDVAAAHSGCFGYF